MCVCVCVCVCVARLAFVIPGSLSRDCLEAHLRLCSAVVSRFGKPGLRAVFYKRHPLPVSFFRSGVARHLGPGARIASGRASFDNVPTSILPLPSRTMAHIIQGFCQHQNPAGSNRLTDTTSNLATSKARSGHPSVGSPEGSACAAATLSPQLGGFSIAVPCPCGPVRGKSGSISGGDNLSRCPRVVADRLAKVVEISPKCLVQSLDR